MFCHRYFCLRCKSFFTIRPYQPKRCPECFGDDQLMGPYLTKEFEYSPI